MKQMEFIQVAVGYIEQEVLPLLLPESPLGRFVVGGLMGTMGGNINNLIMQNADLLKTLGIMDSNENISVDGLKNFLDGAFKASPALEMNFYKDIIAPKFDNPLLKSWFDTTLKLTKEDADRFLSMLPGSAGE